MSLFMYDVILCTVLLVYGHICYRRGYRDGMVRWKRPHPLYALLRRYFICPENIEEWDEMEEDEEEIGEE